MHYAKNNRLGTIPLLLSRCQGFVSDWTFLFRLFIYEYYCNLPLFYQIRWKNSVKCLSQRYRKRTCRFDFTLSFMPSRKLWMLIFWNLSDERNRNRTRVCHRVHYILLYVKFLLSLRVVTLCCTCAHLELNNR